MDSAEENLGTARDVTSRMGVLGQPDEKHESGARFMTTLPQTSPQQ